MASIGLSDQSSGFGAQIFGGVVVLTGVASLGLGDQSSGFRTQGFVEFVVSGFGTQGLLQVVWFQGLRLRV